MVITSFATGRAKFYPIGCFQTGPCGGQWAARKTGSGGRHKAPQKLGERGEYGTKEDHVYVAGKMTVMNL